MVINEYIKKLINDKIKEYDREENIAFVIKGIPLNIIDFKEEINIETLLTNKLKYFNSIFNKRNIFIYEEFLLLNGIITEQYDKIYIINNNLYSKYYPLEIYLKNNIINKLQEQFIDIDEIDDTNDIDELDYSNDKIINTLLQIFDGILQKDNILLCGYNDTIIKDWYKINVIELFNQPYLSNEIQYADQINNMFIIEDDIDCTILVNQIINNNQQEYTLDTSRYTGNTSELQEIIKLLINNIENINLCIYKKKEQIQSSYREESKNILKKYWGYDTFRTFEVYNIEKLEENCKEYLNISQEQIITDIINESENNIKNNFFRDIFVTAPTGIGKSIMFQIPAIYLAEKYDYVTIVISPLIGLMNDQVRNLEIKNYKYVKTINSDISPIKKEEIKEQVTNGEVHILYISPETLLSRSDIENLIGDRTIGLLVIDEAHIVTTWGKQFRPDYWYLGNHIRKLRKKQSEDKNISFIIAAFSATVIYRGKEDMYNETINSLHMHNPISYIGSIIRKNIEINVNKLDTKANEDKYKAYAYHFIMRSNNTGEKVLIYFPFVSLIIDFYEFLRSNKLHNNVAIYFGSLPKEEKNENYEQFYKGNKKVMLATKAFGMGIDIDDISIIAHFAPTGNVCDYVQEIGRVARKPIMQGEACYLYNKQDFKYINSLHGISTIKKYQLIEVMKKIYELAIERKNKSNNIRRKNSMLLDVDNFTYIFSKGKNDEDNNINKVKTTLLLIEKDFENKYGFSPIKMRPVPMYSKGFFKVDEKTAHKLNTYFPDIMYKVSEEYKIYQIDLKSIWEKTNKDISFPMFKYYIYTKNNELAFNLKYNIEPIWKIEVNIKENVQNRFINIWTVIKECINKSIYDNEYIHPSYIVEQLMHKCKLSVSSAQFIIDVVLTSIEEYKKNQLRYNNTQLLNRNLQDGRQMYKFENAIIHYIKAVEGARIELIESIHKNNGVLFYESNNKEHKWLITVLGILEAFGILNFTILGGENKQIYIYLYQTLKIYNIINNAEKYNNRLLENIYERHKTSVEMLKNLFENNYTSDKRWELIEDYFLGIEHN